MTRRVKYNCSICNRSGAGYREKKGDSEENIPPDNWLHVGESIYLCGKCADNPDALHKAELMVEQKEKSDWMFIKLGCLLVILVVAVVVIIGYVGGGFEGLRECLVGLIVLIMLVCAFIPSKK